MNESQLRKLFLIIQNSYSGFLIDDVKVQIWLDVLKDLPFETAQQNLRWHILNQKFPPTPAEINLGADAHLSMQERKRKAHLAQLDQLILEARKEREQNSLPDPIIQRMDEGRWNQERIDNAIARDEAERIVRFEKLKKLET